MIDISIRKSNINEAIELSELILDNATYFLKPIYTQEQWNVFIQYYSIEAILNKIESQDVFCAIKENKIIGTIALDCNFVVGFYTHIQYLNQGVGKELLFFLENYAKEKGLKKIRLASSPVANGFYEKMGWIVLDVLVFEYLGVGFEEALMEKTLI